MIRLDQKELTQWIGYIYSISGIALDSSKGYLLETRFSTLLRETNCSSFQSLLEKVRADSSGALKRKVIVSITTNETSFFRDNAPFEMLKHKIIPDLVDKRVKQGAKGKPITIRVWSAACSTGQEVYSTAICFKEVLHDLTKYDIRILGTDISDKVIAQASYGKYSKLEMERGLAPGKVGNYFNADGPDYRVRDEIRSITTFQNLNLLEPLGFSYKFDIIFCRNVAIYFAELDKRRLFESIAKVIAQDGFLIIGTTETLVGLTQSFDSKRHVHSVYYQLKNSR